MNKLISLCTALLLAVTSAFADGETVIATIGETEYTDVAAFCSAFGNIEEEAAVVLKADVDLGNDGKGYLLNTNESSNITFDLNGYTLTGYLEGIAGTFTIDDSSSEGTGKVKCNDGYYLFSLTNSQKLTINAGTFEAGTILYVNSQSASVTLNGGTFVPKSMHCFEIQQGKITIGEDKAFRDEYFVEISKEITSSISLGGSIEPLVVPLKPGKTHFCNEMVYYEPISSMEAFISLLTAGGKGYLTQDMEVNIPNLRYNKLAASEVRLCLNGHKIYYSEEAAKSTNSYFIEAPNCDLTIDDCDESTTRYWENTEYSPGWKPSENTESDKVTTGGVVNVLIKTKSIVLNGGNVVNRNLASSSVTINGGRIVGGEFAVRGAESIVMNGGVIENFSRDAISFGDCENAMFKMTGGEIRSCSGSVVYSYSPSKTTVYLLGGKVVNNKSRGHYLPVVADHIVLGGSLVFSGNETGVGKDIAVDNKDITVEVSTEVPLTDGAHIGISKAVDTSVPSVDGYPYKYPVLSCDEQYAKYFFACNIDERLVFDSEWNGLNATNRVEGQPTDENDYTYIVNVEDCDPSDVTYQWYTIETATEEMTAEKFSGDLVDGRYNDGKWESVYSDIYVTNQAGKQYIVSFPDGEPKELLFYQSTSEKLADGSYFVTPESFLYISADEDFTCIIKLFSIQQTVVEGQTTNVLTEGEKDVTYMCRVTIGGENIDSKNVTYTRGAVPTSISDIQKEVRSSKAVKRLENGRVVIIRDGEKFDITGRKL